MKLGVKSYLLLALITILNILPATLKAEEIPIIEDIKVELIKETPEIKIASNITIEYLDYTLQAPSRIIIDPLGSVYCNLDQKLFSGEDLVRLVSIVKARGTIPPSLDSSYYPLDFIIIELKGPVHYTVVREEKLVVRLGREIIPLAVKKIEEVRRPTIEIAEVAEPQEVISREVFQEGEIPPVGKEFFDEEKFPLVEKYRIEPGDKLEISVWQHPDLLREIVVRPDGYISFPLSGDIKVDGLTTNRVAREIVLRLSRVLRKPEVSVIITGFGSKGIFVLGAVGKPGLYPYETKMTVLRAVSLADSWQAHAYLKSILVVKKFFAEETEVVRVNLWDVIKKGDINKDIELQAGDIVYVPQSFIGNIGTFLSGLRVSFGSGVFHSID